MNLARPAQAPSLSLADWIVLCVVSERPVHGFAVASLLGADGELGRIWQVARPVTYRCLSRLEQLELIRPAGTEHSRLGPVRYVHQATSAGRLAALEWLASPVEHARDLRSEFLVKLALADRAGLSAGNLITAQHAELTPIARALEEQLRCWRGFEQVLIRWRCETMSAALRFLEALPG